MKARSTPCRLVSSANSDCIHVYALVGENSVLYRTGAKEVAVEMGEGAELRSHVVDNGYAARSVQPAFLLRLLDE